MSAKVITYSSEAHVGLKKGIDKLANAVKVTLGPKGCNVVIDKKFGAPTITKDGVTVAKEIELEDSIENMGAHLLAAPPWAYFSKKDWNLSVAPGPWSVNDSMAEIRETKEAETENVHWREARSIQKVARSNLARSVVNSRR